MEKEQAYESIIDDEEFDRKLLAESIEPYVRIGKESKDVLFLDKFSNLTNKNKVLVYLLAQKVREDLDEQNHLVFPDKISSDLGINDNTVRSVLKRLRQSDLVKKRSGNNYEIPNYRVEEVVEELG
jgi:RNA-binding protein YhbY